MDRRLIEKMIEHQTVFDIKQIANVFGEADFSLIIEMIFNLTPEERNIIFSQNKKFNAIPILRDPRFNEKGLHPFRMFLSNLIYHQAFLKSNEDTDFLKNGYLIVEDFLDLKSFRKLKKIRDQYIAEAGDDKFHTRKYYIDLSSEHGSAFNFFDLEKSQNLFKKVTASKNYAISAKRIERIIHKDQDIQKEIHTDTFHPTIKFWFFHEDVNVESGPTYYSIGSSIPTIERFAWEYRKSLNAHLSDNQGTAEGSFRANPEDLELMGYRKMQPITCSGNSVIVFNTQGFHCRGPAKTGTIRDSIMGIFRMNPFKL